MIYFVHRDSGNNIVFISGSQQPGYADEQVDDSVPELAAYLAKVVAQVDPSDSNNLSKALKAILILAATGGTGAGKTPAQIRAAFLAAWNSLP